MVYSGIEERGRECLYMLLQRIFEVSAEATLITEPVPTIDKEGRSFGIIPNLLPSSRKANTGSITKVSSTSAYMKYALVRKEKKVSHAYVFYRRSLPGTRYLLVNPTSVQ